MDGNRFDDISKAIASRSTRRQALRQVGSGGVLAGIASVVGLGRVRALAQDDDIAANSTCTMQFSAELAVGPDKSTTYSGTIDLEFDSTGAIDNGVFHGDDGNDYDLVGQVVGRAVNLLITFNTDKVIALTGTSATDATLCQSTIMGTLSGPKIRDIGTWLATKGQGSSSSGGGTNIVGGSSSGGSSSGGSSSGGTNSGGDSGGGNSSGGSTDNGPTPTACPTIDCGSTFVLNPDTCLCDCPSPYVKCGDATCCFGGAVCNTDGSCQCPAGTEPCNEVCTTSCASGTHFDDNCQCVAETSCGMGETLCNGACVSLSCPADQLFDSTSCGCVNRCSPGQGYCGGSCIDIVNDRNNCGLCANMCPTGMPCIAGTCECPATTNYDSVNMKCV